MNRPRFVVDTMLGRLARWLRAMGYDTAYPGQAEDSRLLDLARAEDRILVTRDGALARRAGARGCLIRSGDVEGQLAEALEKLRLQAPETAWLSRCMECNAVLEANGPESVRDRVPFRVLARHTRFMSCPGCRRVYWWGSHADRIQERLAILLARSGRP